MNDQIKNALVVGASSGYGKGIADYLEAENYNVIRASRTSTYSVDVVHARDVQLLFDHEDIRDLQFDIIVYSAGLAIGNSPVIDKDPKEMKRVLDVNTLGLFHVAKYGLPFLMKRKGLFVHIGSIAYAFTYSGGVDYCAAKSASASFMQGIRHELIGSNVRTCSLEVGLGDTPFQEKRYDGDMEKAAKHYEGVRMLKPIYIGRLIHFISSAPAEVNFDSVVIKPTDQVTHGKTIKHVSEERKDYFNKL